MWAFLSVDRATFRRARDFLAAQRWRIVVAGACGLLSAVCFVSLVLVVACLGELLFSPSRTLEPFAERAAQSVVGRPLAWVYGRVPALRDSVQCLGLLIATTVVLAAVRSLCHYGQAQLIATAIVDASRRMRRAVYHHAYRLGTTEVSGIGAAPAINAFTRETDLVRDGLGAWLDVSVRDPIKIVLLLALALMAHWALALLFLLLAVMSVFLARGQIRWARARAAEAVRHAAERLALLQESLALIRLTRGYLMEGAAQRHFERDLAQFASSEQHRLSSASAVRPLIDLVVVLCITLVVGLASFNLMLDALSPFSTVVLYASLISLYWPVQSITARDKTIRAGVEAAKPLFAFLDQQTRLVEIVGAQFLSPMSKSLEFDGIRAQDPGSPPVLDGLNLTIRAGSRVAIVGMDEQAKRALVYMIPRFLDPTDGQVRIDGQDIRLATLESLRAQVAMVLQGELTFTDTVAGNIGCGDMSFGLPHIVEASKIAHAHNFVQRLPKGYDTLIGEQGEILSIGQQFRIALARAIVRDPTITVIEEPTGHIDDDTKHLLDDTFSRFCPGRTVIFLAHRLSTLRACDQIVILHEGKVAMVGTHRELTMKSELYRHLQYSEFNVFAAG